PPERPRPGPGARLLVAACPARSVQHVPEPRLLPARARLRRDHHPAPEEALSVPLVAVRDLRVYFKIRQGWVRAFDGVNLSIDRGETVGLVGESGCGKTTLASAITQLLTSNAHILGGQVIWEPDGK